MKNLLGCLLIIFALAPGLTNGQEPVLAVNEPVRSPRQLIEEVTKPIDVQHAAEDDEEKPKLTFSGYIDSYFLHAFNDPKSGNLMGAPSVNGGFPAGRAFDRVTDQLALGLVQTKLTYSDDKSDLVIDLAFGPNAELGNFGNVPVHASGTTNLWSPGSGYVSALYGTSAAIKQAYFTYKATERLSFTVGQFGTHIGYEVIDAPTNFNYSLSNLFNNGPFYHIGMKAGYVVNDKLSLMVGLVNNWDNLFDNNKQKSVVGQVYLSPAQGFNIYVNYIGGHGDDTYLSTVATASASPFLENYNRSLFDLTTGYQVTDRFYVGLNAAYGFYHFKTNDVDEGTLVAMYGSTSPKWGGAAVYSNYKLSNVLALGVRYETFEDPKFVRYLGANNTSFTLTAPITLANEHIIVKPELRIDRSTTPYYENSDGNAVKDQQTLGLAFIYKY
ncbi:MAG: outer membrane beta-barrel protein [Cyclobacteriaceae bacterium]